ncbi:MAG: glutamate--tRNA ligase [Candidatus Omnitrophica bacterium]|nr:glutamate--tRNA ligase [Candidatus Omnitrophota bacterium]MCM8791444.1 glutamate--tRNA ligase [Candidatus Omnitrophota bacterium]
MVRVRFAPSPTGYLHIGSARTALFNWLYARHYGGKFLLRIEDTDKTRSEKKYLDEILTDLRWLGLDWDEEPIYQSERFDVYRASAEELVRSGKAYREGEAYIFRIEKGRTITFDDMIHGKVSVNTDDIKDQVLIKSDGSPAYNFCCVIDDAFLNITHIIRGDDHISNTPKQILFYEALGLQSPQFGHMPLIMGQDGAKLSKRHGGVAVEEYKRQGFLPESLVNYLLLLGWSPGDDRQIISLSEAVKIFDIKDMRGVQAKFDLQKLRWMNGEYIAAKKTSELLPLIKKQIADAAKEIPPDDKLAKVIDLYKVRIKTLSEFIPMTDHFFSDVYTVEEKGVEKYLKPAESKMILRQFADRIESLSEFSHENLEKTCRTLAEEKGLKTAQIIHPTRVAISGKTTGAGLFEMMEVLGKEKVLERLRMAQGA